MASEARKLQVGGFVLTALTIAVAGIIWLGATQLFQSTVTMVTYFPESVQGLDRGAPVKFRGVPAGRVDDIGIAPDRDLIEVVMSIDREYVPLLTQDPRVRAQLGIVGITGLRYVEISRHVGASLDHYPRLTFDPPYPVIPSAPSPIKELTTALDDIYDRLMELDLEGISGDLRVTLQATSDLLQDERLSATLGNLESASRSASLVAEDLSRFTADGRLERTLVELETTSRDARGLVSKLDAQLSGDELQQTVRSAARMTAAGEGLMQELQLTVERLDVAAGNVEGLTMELRDQPSLLLFAEPREPRRPGGAGRRAGSSRSAPSGAP